MATLWVEYGKSMGDVGCLMCDVGCGMDDV